MCPAAGVILVIEDDVDTRSVLCDILTDHGFHVAEAATGTAAIAILRDREPDLILLDLGLPDVSGLDVLIDLTSTSSAPVIVVSGRSGETDTVVGLELGAIDYITKPFRERELIARVNAALRRGEQHAGPSTIEFGPLVIDEAAHEVTVEGRNVDLTPKEFSLLAFMASAPRQVFSRKQLLDQVWDSSPSWQDDNTVGEHVYRIRRKLDPDQRSRWIETVRGVGYRFTPEADGGDPRTARPDKPTSGTRAASTPTPNVAL